MNTHHRTATIAIVTVLASLSLTGCGGGQSERKVSDTSAGQGAVEPFGAVAQAEASPAASVPPGRIIESVPADSLPPDVAASAADRVQARQLQGVLPSPRHPGTRLPVAVRPSARRRR